MPTCLVLITKIFVCIAGGGGEKGFELKGEKTHITEHIIEMYKCGYFVDWISYFDYDKINLRLITNTKKKKLA